MRWNKNTGWAATPDEIMDLCTTFPTINISQQLVRMDGWLRANPRKRYKNWDRFVFNWLAREEPPAERVVLSKPAEQALHEMLTLAEKHHVECKPDECAAALALMYTAQGSLPDAVSREEDFYQQVKTSWWEYLYYHDHYRRFGTKRSLQSFLTWDKWKGPHESTDYATH